VHTVHTINEARAKQSQHGDQAIYIMLYTEYGLWSRSHQKLTRRLPCPKRNPARIICRSLSTTFWDIPPIVQNLQ